MALSPPLLYAITILSWGTTWFAIRFQLGPVDPLVSVMWRFALAAALLLAWIAWRRLPVTFSARQFAWLCLQGACLFSINYALFYTITAEMTSGLVALTFSSVVVMNIVNGAIFLRRPISPMVSLGAVSGLLGLALVFWPEVAAGSTTPRALGIAALATWLASIGNIISARNQAEGMPVLQSNAIGMAAGTALAGIWLIATDTPISLPTTAPWLLSWLYLAVVGSVIAFGAYLALIGQIGADRAAYASVVFPLVALAISTVFEGYDWPPQAVPGILLVLAGNALILDRRHRDRLRHWLRLPRRPAQEESP